MNTTTKKQNEINLTVKNYNFNLSESYNNYQQSKDYYSLCQELENRGLKKFDTLSFQHKGIIENRIYKLEKDFIFSNQLNAGGFRVFDWYEVIYPNKSIKQGYYLINDDNYKKLIDLRKNTFACGYCGKQSINPKNQFCFDCLGSEYLKESDLFLLELKAISDINPRNNDITLPKGFFNLYLKIQKKSRLLRLNREKKDNKQRAIDEVKNCRLEYLAKKWLVNHNFNFDNVIYYSHTKKFCFGWRESIRDKAKDILIKKLKNFLYAYEIK